MSYTDRNEISNQSSPGEAEKTLRLIARLPAPQGLEDRVHRGLRNAPRGGRLLSWPAAQSSSWMRAAAAAAIVFVVAGGGWGIYSRVEPGQPTRGIAGPHLAAPGGFTEGGAVRRPQTLVGPAVTPAITHPAAAAKPRTPAKSPLAPAAKSIAVSKAAALPATAPVQ